MLLSDGRIIVIGAHDPGVWTETFGVIEISGILSLHKCLSEYMRELLLDNKKSCALTGGGIAVVLLNFQTAIFP